jgi:serine protease Do
MAVMRKNLLTLLLGAFGGLVSFAILYQFIEKPSSPLVDKLETAENSEQNKVPTKLVTDDYFTSGSLDFTYAAEKSLNAVVHVKTEFTIEKQPHPFSYFFNADPKPRQYKGRSSGSGVIISDDGYIVTNNHVVDNSSRILITLHDNSSYEAKFVGSDPATDLAVLKIDCEDTFNYLTYANSDEIKVGEWVLAVGNPYSLTSTVTAGIISAKSRNLNILQYDPSKDVFPIESFLQTDAAVNPGNSGGALVNTNGDLIGINTAIASTTGSYTGYSFAIPSNIAGKVITDIIEFGKVQRAFLGVSIREISQDLTDKKSASTPRGLRVFEVHEIGGAKDAGIAIDDVILKIGAIEVRNIPEFQEQMSKFRPGDKISLTILRKDKEMVVPVELKNREGKTELISIKDKAIAHLFGADLSTPESFELKSLGLKSGVKVNTVNPGVFRQVGIKEGFIITKIDNTPVNSLSHFEELVGKKEGGILIEGIYPNGKKAYYGIGI